MAVILEVDGETFLSYLCDKREAHLREGMSDQLVVTLISSCRLVILQKLINIVQPKLNGLNYT